MTRYYCTVFDRAYLCKGLALYESLLRHSSSPFCLYVLALDEPCRIELARLNLEQAITIECEYFVDQMRLREIRKNRTHQEWCWSTASSFLDFLMQSGLRECTYLDADTIMLADPEAAFPEMLDCSIGITPHRFIAEKQYLEATSGKFNVGWVTIRQTPAGRKCLARWVAQVRERCSADVGCGDQKILDEWPSLYGEDLCVFENIGVNAGPWTLGNWEVTEGPCLDGIPIISYHAHEFMEREDGTFRLTNYDLRDDHVIYIYRPYVAAYTAAKERIESLHLQRA